MGLFGDKRADELKSLLSSMQGSSLEGIQAILDWKSSGESGPGPDSTLNRRISEAAALVTKMRGKGKVDQAEAILRDYESQPVPQSLLFRADAPTSAAFDKAAAEAAERLDAMGPDPEQQAKDAMWRSIVAEVRTRARD